ncbi:MAG: lysoplasmalogenase family protein [Oscillospiraceae bacterium]|nr:lysoplasmalogenase family protein [Oscillospiraceae bacterium]
MPYYITIGIITLYSALLVYYCVLEKKEKFWPATWLKIIISAFAALCAVYAAVELQNYIFYIFALGLVFAVPADYFLQYIKTDLKRYRFGIFFFGAMHACLLVSFYLVYPFTFYEVVIWVSLLVILLVFQIIGKWKMGKEKLQLTVYTVLVTFMAAKAISLYFIAPSTFTLMASLGGLLFFLSDLFLGIWDYQCEKFVYLALNRVIYFAGQLCLAFYLITMN